VNLHPPNSAVFRAGVGWQVHAGGGHAGADSTVKMITHEAAVHCCALKDMTTLWAAATFMSLGDAPQRHRGPHPLVAAAAFGGPHAKGWPALHPLSVFVTHAGGTRDTQTQTIDNDRSSKKAVQLQGKRALAGALGALAI
jgi:hypothetical protein